MDVTVADLSDNVCTSCDEQNVLTVCDYTDAPGSCQWLYTVDDANYVTVVVRKSGSNYYLTVEIGFDSAGGGCTAAQVIQFERDLGTTKPACISDLNGSVPFLQSTNPAGGTWYSDPNAGCTVDASTCDLTFSA